MDKFRIKAIETQSTQEVANRVFDPKSEEGVNEAFKVALGQLAQPDLFYLEVDAKNTHCIVKRRADNSVVYFTDVPPEIITLRKIGLE